MTQPPKADKNGRRSRDSAQKESSGNTQKKRAETKGSSTSDGRSAGTVPFPVVALGASAGGLDPLKEFFSAVPENCDMAFVVIHFSPNHKSSLPDLLAHHTSMPVVTAEDGQMIERNTVYVTPPDSFLAVESARLKLSDMPGKHHLSVDHFLRSLAADRAEQAVAVILSGTGSDGTLGIQAIKGNEGLVAVQNPDTAEYPGMPASAVETDLVDFVLPVADIPTAIVSYFKKMLGSRGKKEIQEAPKRTKELNAILDLLRTRTGHDFSGYKVNTVLRRVGRRMAVHGLDTHASYLRLLRDQPEELDTLNSELLIPVTGFFRDAEAFETLEKKVLPKLLEKQDREDTVRIWVPGCSTGEEAYSIAILAREVMEDLGHRPSVQIFATDLDVSALEKARKGRYPHNIDLDVSQERLERFFTRERDYYEVIPQLREMLVFAKQDVIKDAPFSRVDLVSCRNLLIYLGLELQKQLLPTFHYALKPNGYLFLGSAETVGNLDDLFAVVDRRWKIYQRRDNEMARREYYRFPKLSQTSGTPKAQPPHEEKKPGEDYGPLVRGLLLRDHVPAAVLINRQNELLYLHGSTGHFIELTTGHPTNDLLRMVRTGLEGLSRSLIQRVRGAHEQTARATGYVQVGGRSERVQITARGLKESEAPAGAVLLLFENVDYQARETNEETGDDNGTSESDREKVLRLERELSDTREELRTTTEELEASNEELQSSNEELQSSNEELQSSNEELETSREELQSVNDELRSVNAELENKVDEATRTQEDMNVMLASTEIGVVFVDNRLHIERFTPAVTAIIPIRDTDIGRPIQDLSHKLQREDLQKNLGDVVTSMSRRQQEVHGEDGHTYIMRMRPYRNAAGRVEGAVMVFIDITEEAKMAFLGKLRDALGQSEDLVLLLDLDGGVEYVNQAFCEATGFQPEEVIGQVPDALAEPGLSAEDRRQMGWNLRNGRSWRGDFQCQCRGGGVLMTQAFFAPIRTSEGRVSHAVAYLHPLTESCEKT